MYPSSFGPFMGWGGGERTIEFLADGKVLLTVEVNILRIAELILFYNSGLPLSGDASRFLQDRL